MLRENIAFWEEVGNLDAAGWSKVCMGTALGELGEHELALAQVDDGISLLGKTHWKWGISVGQHYRGKIFHKMQDHAAALGCYLDSLEMRRELGDKLGIAETLEEMAYLGLDLESPNVAARLFAQSESIRESIKAPMPPCDSDRHQRCLAQLKKELGADKFSTVQTEGHAMTLEQAVEHAVTFASKYPDAD